ncbi:M23 family metallopeptidase [Leucobacter denitrificans]|uniref:M23 family metallopeptidase n=1 Tax=Leucobacter denitrificans TaxID=683042 RepID=A0A7G9S4Y2_9MICO|nr:peptidoglycan DD-metalloendopeptidase family protein [Leucobacter denitrificans]QNN62907.1 M23 family metallopeptidase [Leucobacter denitrificans]
MSYRSVLTRTVGTLLPGLMLVSTVLSVPAESSKWQPPVEDPLRVSGPYRAPASPYASGHRGIDLPAQPGKSVIAPVAGSVSFVGYVVDRPVLSIRIDSHTVLTFEPIETHLREGDVVARGDVAGVAGSGGHCLSECVHLGVRVDGAYVNPMRYFLHKPVLLPW